MSKLTYTAASILFMISVIVFIGSFVYLIIATFTLTEETILLPLRILTVMLLTAMLINYLKREIIFK